MSTPSISEVEVENVFIGAGCNRIVNSVSWGGCGLISFGAQNAVAIFCPKSAQILTTLPGHKATVNCTYWLSSSKYSSRLETLDQQFLLSGDASGVVILWEHSVSNKTWRHVMQVPQLHKKGITCLSGLVLSQDNAIFASSSSDCTISIWNLLNLSSQDNINLSNLDPISVSKPIVTLSLAELPGTSGHIALAIGGLDNKIHLYCSNDRNEFFHACELKAHTDWIRSLDFSLPLKLPGEDTCLLLASSSQDKGIRIWKISPKNPSSLNEEITPLSYIEGPKFVSGASTYQVGLESLLLGHEDWVYSVQWQPPSSNGQPLSILSASMDKTMMIWQPEKATGIWMNVVTVGELCHSALGFYGGHWSPDGAWIIAHAYGGAFHMWKKTDVGSWSPAKVPSGHFGAVTDISWARNGEFLLSVSNDQTSRVFAPWVEPNSWREIARPQVHGHDINCVSMITGSGNFRYVCGADEKVSRVFEAPLSFLKTLRVTGCQIVEEVNEQVQVLGANMSALGLSQKPIYTNNAATTARDATSFEGIESVPEAVPVVFIEPPIEDELAYHTLWPETQKLYGHGNEIFSLCCDHGGRQVASSCKAQTSSVAEVWIWEVGTWKTTGRLGSHSLTVTQMEFSPDDSMLLTVSRDRHFSIFKINKVKQAFELLVKKEAHKRIIWACAWDPFGHYFATGSRDKTVKVWNVDGACVHALPPFGSSVTALSWTGIDGCRNRGLLAVGEEDGSVGLWRADMTDGGPVDVGIVRRLRPFDCHVSAVHRLSWKGRSGECEPSDALQLASCGADHCVRVFNVFCDRLL